MHLFIHISLALIALYGIIQSLRDKAWISLLIGSALLLSTLISYLDPVLLFYHSAFLRSVSAIALLILVLFPSRSIKDRHVVATLLVLIPFILVTTFKSLQLAGTDMLKWSLVLTLVSFLYYTVARRIWDHQWAYLFFFAVNSALVLFF